MRTTGKATDLITFSRSSGGTALRKIAYGPEFVTNGTFDTDISGWAAAAGAILSLNTNRLRVQNPAGSSFVYASQAVSVEVGRVYRLSVDVVGGTGNIYVRVGTSAGGAQIVSAFENTSSGQKEASFVATSSTIYLSLYSNGVEGAYVDFDNVSVKEVLFDQGDLTLFNHPADIPRIEYDANGNVLGLLVEEARTNLLRYSEEFDNAAWTKSPIGNALSVVVTPNQGLSPFNENTADRAVFDLNGNTGSADISTLRQSVTVNSEGTFGIWIKSFDGVSSYNMTLTAGGAEVYITVTGEWQLFTATATTSGGITPGLFLRGARVPANSDTADVLLWGAQLEAGAFPTSYIPTSGSTATRAADVASIATSEFGYNKTNTVGTFYVSWDTFDAGEARALSVTDAGGSNRTVDMFFSTATDRTDVYSNHTTSGLYNLGSPVSGLNKMIAAMKENDAAACTNGGTVVTDTTTTAPIAANKFNMGSFGGSSYLNGHIKSIKYYPRRLTNDQLQEITS